MAKELTKENKAKPVLVVAHARNLRVAPRKLRLVTNLVKRTRVENALTQLEFLNKKGAPMVSKLLRSAVANAVNNFSLKAEDLVIESITCDQGPVMMRYMPRARGSASPIRRKTSHLHVTLVSVPAKKKSKAAVRTVAAKKGDAEAKKHVEHAEAETIQDSSKAKPLQAKPSELRKANTVQQKRRLFNRKSGE